MNEVNNNNSPTISVIVPVYNAENTLHQCVDSILNQEYKQIEVILVDDGSRDSSPQICDEYAEKDKRVHVFHKPNGGVSSARNLGLDHAHGKWITFIDSDDSISEGYYTGIEDRKEDIIFLGYKTFYKGILIKDISIPKELFDNAFKNMIKSNFSNSIVRGPCAKFYKMDLLSGLRFNPEMTIGEDLYFVLDYLSRCVNYHVKSDAEYIILYCGTPDERKYSISVDKAAYSLGCIKDAFDKIIRKHGVDKSLMLSYINYFKRISKSDWINNPSKWWNNKAIKNLYRYVWPALSFRQKLRLVAARLLRR